MKGGIWIYYLLVLTLNPTNDISLMQAKDKSTETMAALSVRVVSNYTNTQGVSRLQ